MTKVLVASKEPSVFDLLSSTAPNVELIAALDTGRIYSSIPMIELAIIDYRDLVPHPFSVECIRRLLAKTPIKQCSAQEFLASPEEYLRIRGSNWRPFELLAQRTIALTSYSGGTGKTSLALDTALHFAAKTESRLPLPVAVFELTYGSSALNALIRVEAPTIDKLMRQPELEPGTFHGVTLYPMNYADIRPIPIEHLKRYLEEQMSHHVLNIIDAVWPWPHGLASLIGEEVDLWIVLTTPRIDAVDNARKLQRLLSAEHGAEKVAIAVNQMGGLGASLALMGFERDIEIPRIQQAEVFFGGRIGKEILGHVYNSLWAEYERAGRRRWRLFRRRKA
ncbi:MAG: hypothetical protein H5T69_09105 [Chloroflexi bacterium]|nr:hypothetical protein [Chloroflexota bacterium]